MLLQALATGVNIVHRIGQMPKISTALQDLGVPVVGELDLGAVVASGRQKHQGETPRRDVFLANHFKA